MGDEAKRAADRIPDYRAEAWLLAEGHERGLGALSSGQRREIAHDLGLEADQLELFDDGVPQSAEGRHGWLARLLEKVETWLRDGSRRDELANLPADLRGEIARDLALSVDELDRLASATPSAPGLIYARLRELGFTMEELVASGIGSRVDLERTCGLCPDRLVCAHDLDERPESTEWRKFCPNNATFEAMERQIEERGDTARRLRTGR